MSMSSCLIDWRFCAYAECSPSSLIPAFVSLPPPHPYLCLYSSLLQTVHLKTSSEQRRKDEESGKTPLTVVPSYTNTGYDMRQLALDARDKKKKSK
jgi:hypothetical protein